MSEATRVLVATFFSLAVCQSALACGSAFRFWDDINEPRDDVALEDCRNRGREARDAGSSPYRAFDIYEECTREAGLR